MGAEAFTHISHTESGKVDDAFRAAQDQARYDHGHSGYTGTIAEKGEWTIVQGSKLALDKAIGLAEKLLDEDDPRVTDKWGPAGAIPIDDGGWLFFGWASC